MGLYSDNFWSYLFGSNKVDRIAEDSDSNGYKHPDGSLCKAKKRENCPYWREEEKKDEVDDIEVQSEVSKVQNIATPEEMEIIKKGGLPNDVKFEKVAPSDLSTTKVGSTKSKYREMRNREVAYIAESNKEDGTYPLVDVTDKQAAENLEPVTYPTGYMVSFQTTNGEGYNKGRKDLTIPDEEYDEIVEDLAEETGSKPHIGVFGGIPEISFRCDSKELAKRIMQKYNQVSMWDNARAVRAEKASKDNNLSDEVKRVLWGRCEIFNGKYNWKTNQVTKTK